MYFGNALKRKYRPERYTKIVLGSVVEIDFVSGLETQTKRSKPRLAANSRINHAIDIIRT
jgi:hypothetical protein